MLYVLWSNDVVLDKQCAIILWRRGKHAFLQGSGIVFESLSYSGQKRIKSGSNTSL